MYNPNIIYGIRMLILQPTAVRCIGGLIIVYVLFFSCQYSEKFDAKPWAVHPFSKILHIPNGVVSFHILKNAVLFLVVFLGICNY